MTIKGQVGIYFDLTISPEPMNRGDILMVRVHNKPSNERMFEREDNLRSFNNLDTKIHMPK